MCLYLLKTKYLSIEGDRKVGGEGAKSIDRLSWKTTP